VLGDVVLVYYRRSPLKKVDILVNSDLVTRDCDRPILNRPVWTHQVISLPATPFMDRPLTRFLWAIVTTQLSEFPIPLPTVVCSCLILT
jgi:hypothetical protein